MRSAQGAVTQARVFENPALFVSSLGKNLSPFDSPIPNQVGVTWTIPIGGKRGAGIASARAAVDSARATRIASRRDLGFAVETAFIGVLLDQTQLDFARQDQQGLHQAEQIDELRYKDGKISYGDLLKLRIQVSGADDVVRQAELTLADDRTELIRLVGGGVLASDFHADGSLAPPADVQPPTADALLTKALANRTDYQALQADVRSARAALSQARRQPIPDLGVLFDYNRIPGEAGAYDVQLTASIPVFDRNRGNTTQADAALRKANLAAESMRDQLRADAAQAVHGLNTARARLQVYDHDLLAAAKQSLDISRHAYEEGRGSLLDYLDSEASYRQVESAYRSAVADAMLAAARLRYVAGEDLP